MALSYAIMFTANFNLICEVQGFDSKLQLQSYKAQTTSTLHLAFKTEQKEYPQEYRNNSPSYHPKYMGRGLIGFN